MGKYSRPLPPFPEKIKKWPGKKDTKKWCKGVVGREHKPGEWEPLYHPNSAFRVKVCKVCGKHLEFNCLL